MSILRSLELPERVRSGWLATERGTFAMLEAQPALGVAYRRPALLVHGFTGSKENFLPVLEPLAAAGRMVVAVDLRGQYESPHAPDRAGYAPAALAADVLAMAAAIAPGGAPVHLAGHSMGGLVARDAVLDCPAAFCSLTLLGSGPGAIDGQRAGMLRDLLSLLDPEGGAVAGEPSRLAGLVRQAWQEVHEPQARAEGTAEHIIDFLRERTLRTSPVSLVVLARYLLHCPDRTGELAALVAGGLPAAVVYGENDDAWPPAEQDLMASQLGAERTCIPGAAHSPAIEAPVTTASTLTGFWNSAERRAPTVHTCDRHRAAAGSPAAADSAARPGVRAVS